MMMESSKTDNCENNSKFNGDKRYWNSVETSAESWSYNSSSSKPLTLIGSNEENNSSRSRQSSKSTATEVTSTSNEEHRRDCDFKGFHLKMHCCAPVEKNRGRGVNSSSVEDIYSNADDSSSNAADISSKADNISSKANDISSNADDVLGSRVTSIERSLFVMQDTKSQNDVPSNSAQLHVSNIFGDFCKSLDREGLRTTWEKTSKNVSSFDKVRCCADGYCNIVHQTGRSHIQQRSGRMKSTSRSGGGTKSSSSSSTSRNDLYGRHEGIGKHNQLNAALAAASRGRRMLRVGTAGKTLLDLFFVIGLYVCGVFYLKKIRVLYPAFPIRFETAQAAVLTSACVASEAAREETSTAVITSSVQAALQAVQLFLFKAPLPIWLRSKDWWLLCPDAAAAAAGKGGAATAEEAAAYLSPQAQAVLRQIFDERKREAAEELPSLEESESRRGSLQHQDQQQKQEHCGSGCLGQQQQQGGAEMTSRSCGGGRQLHRQHCVGSETLTETSESRRQQGHCGLCWFDFGCCAEQCETSRSDLYRALKDVSYNPKEENASVFEAYASIALYTLSIIIASLLLGMLRPGACSRSSAVAAATAPAAVVKLKETQPQLQRKFSLRQDEKGETSSKSMLGKVSSGLLPAVQQLLNEIYCFSIEFLLFPLPAVFLFCLPQSLTLFTGLYALLAATLFCCCSLRYILVFRPYGSSRHMLQHNQQQGEQPELRRSADAQTPPPDDEKQGQLEVIDLYRGSLMMATCVAIMGVDFFTFPRNFAKTTQSGISLMDFGVGCFIFLGGFVCSHARGHPSTQQRDEKEESEKQDPCSSELAASSVQGENGARTFYEKKQPEDREHEEVKPRARMATRRSRLQAVASKCFALIVMGMIRLASIAFTDYHTSVTEYGIHWNFFFTLAVVSIAAEILFMGLRLTPVLYFPVGLILAAVYEGLLFKYDAAVWVLTAPRDTFFRANREGILGCVGFTALYMMGAGAGNFVLNIWKRKQIFSHVMRWFSGNLNLQNPRQNSFFISLFCSISALMFWGIHYLLLNYYGIRPMRRLVNLSWISLVLSMNLMIICLYCAVDGLLGRNTWAAQSCILFGFSLNQIPLFLSANILTGVFSLNVQTLLQPPVFALSIIIFYCFILCGLAYALARLRLVITLLPLLNIRKVP